MSNRKIINYGKQYIDDNDIQSVINVLRSDYLTTGPKIDEFEKELSRLTDYKFSIAVSSGTAALHAAINALGLLEGSEIIVPSISFVATSNIVLYENCKPVFCDVDPNTLLIDIDQIESLITSKTKAIIAVDYAGQQCDYKKIKAICIKHDLYFIVDACHSLGIINPLCQNQIPHMVCYSFHPVKHITTGEGGAICTNDSLYDSKIKAFRNHGRYGFEMYNLGYNYRMSDINAALGISQINKLYKFIDRRREIADKYNTKLNKSIQLKKINSHVYHLYVIKITERKQFIEYMRVNGVICSIHYPPIYLQPYYINNGFGRFKKFCPNTEMIKNEIVSIPIYYSLSDKDQEYIIDLINKFVEQK